MLGRRLASAAILLPMVGLAVYRGGTAYFLLVTLVVMLAAHEFYCLMGRAGYRTLSWLGLGFILVILVDGLYQEWGLGRLALVGAVLASLGWYLFRREENILASWALTLAGVLYLGWLGQHFLLLRYMPGGLGWTALALGGAWACDSGAYAVGSLVGRRGFFTRISPRKTWEGAVGGWICGILVTLLAASILKLAPGYGLLLGVMVVLAATFGDLAESLVKRQVGAKDSGGIIPGHGGMLDRIDSLLFVVPVVYHLARVFGSGG